ncbi:probable mediator of RNA polymerase II transcription subunit 26a isoform X1 [Syzygium oleosum]|uniref:probable mediator of RNA polymerase II transcription subunit 26a isoform X1 n=1 Tax=Syzygium oleosum TaxID=219896 RepID=UPI0024BA6B1D|nr:probable mediator of RNA polymerase II transcription subunit 26a isoform X1 [Syzygium oleosum]
MGESFDVWRIFFRTTDTDVFQFIDKAIMIAALDCPEDFLSRRGRIAERLFSCETTQAGSDGTRATKENRANSDMGNVALDGVSKNCSHGETEANSETSQLLVGQVLRIKRVLDNSQHESDSALYESLRRLQSMSITLDILEKTKIGISVNSLRRNCGSKQIAQLACDITMGWKAMVEDFCRSTEDVAVLFVDPHKVGDGTTSSVKNQNISKPGQINESGSLVNGNRRLNVNQHKGIVKPNMSSNTNSRTIPASDIASRKFAKERMLKLQSSHRPVAGCERPLGSRQERIKGWDEVVADMKFQATKRKMQELYQRAEMDKRRRTVQELDPRDLPKMATSHKASRATIARGSRRRMISRSRVSCV